MTSLKQQLQSYGAYHRDPRNRPTHFLGVPLVTFALFLALGWFRFVHAPELPVTGATIFYLVVLLYYVRLDWTIALIQAPFSLALLGLADRAGCSTCLGLHGIGMNRPPSPGRLRLFRV
jgi:uncharacterized membrane protein YGL010W